MKNMLQSTAKKAALMGAALVVTAGSAMAQLPTAEVTDAIDDAETAATAIGTAGLTLLGIFIGFKLLRRAANRLT
ncbi:MAG TPA: major capsid protein [Chthoniobacteraceae bacterium]|nr:major capsid protein [Chthoniobacteraceae bacterium]